LAHYLVEELDNLLSLEWAGVTDLTSIDALQGLTDLSGGVEVELGGGDISLLAIEEGDNDVILRLGHLAGGEVADQTPVASLGLGLGNESKSEAILLVS